MKIFIGHDTRYKQATKVCKKSIEDHSEPGEHQIIYLHKDKMREHGIYGREDVAGESTQFSFTRFYVPLMSNYEGVSLFCDNDFLWKCNPTELVEYLRNKPVACTKHKLDGKIHENKMDGIENKAYPKKCWSSLMLFDNNKCQNLTKEYLDNASPADLHQFAWVEEDRIAPIPRMYNHLVGYYKTNPRIKAVHFTQGGPWFKKYKNGEFSEEWWKVLNSLYKVKR